MRLLIALLALSLPIACSEESALDEYAWMAGFACEDGKYFRLELHGQRARVTTAAGNHLLRETTSPRGRAYASEDALLLVEDEVAQLRGLPEGLYQNCRQLRASGAVPE